MHAGTDIPGRRRQIGRSYRADRSVGGSRLLSTQSRGNSQTLSRGRSLSWIRMERSYRRNLHVGGPRLPAGGRFAAYRFLTNLPGLEESPSCSAAGSSHKSLVGFTWIALIRRDTRVVTIIGQELHLSCRCNTGCILMQASFKGIEAGKLRNR